MALAGDHGSDELGAFTHASSIYEVPFCDEELEASKEVCEASLWSREVVPWVVGPEVLVVRKSDDESLRGSQG